MAQTWLATVVPLIVIYVVLSILWIGFAYEAAPSIIIAAYNEKSLWFLNWVFQGRRSLPVEHFLQRWNVIAAAVLIAALLHFLIVVLIESIDRRHRSRLVEPAKSGLWTNSVLIGFSAAFLGLTAASWGPGDYSGYLYEWLLVLDGRDPWYRTSYPDHPPNFTAMVARPSLNPYGPLFNALAPLVWVNPLANKLLFAFSYLVYLIWLIKDFAPRHGCGALWWPWLGLWLLNPFPWVEIAYLGYFDVLVGIACVAAVHSLIDRKDGASGSYLALGILLKYMPIVILPFLVFSEGRFRARVLSFCVGLVLLGLAVSAIIWGKSTFLPLTFAATRDPHWSIYHILASTHSPLRLFWDSTNSLDWLEKPLLVAAGLGVFAWCVLRRTGPALSAVLAVLVTLLFYRAGYINYQIVPFLLISYWIVSERERLEKHFALAAALNGYFGVLAVLELVHWSMLTEGTLYSNIVIFKFLLGCAILVGLARFSARAR